MARGFTMTHWTTKNGLPTNEINSIWKTSDGYIWLETVDGLVRFDGHTFTLFNNENQHAFRGTNIFSLSENGDKDFWFDNSPDNSGYFIHYQDGRFLAYPLNLKGKQRVLGTWLTRSDHLWVASSHGIFEFKNNRFRKRFANRLLSGIIGISGYGNTVLIITKEGYYQYANGMLSKIRIHQKHYGAALLTPSGALWSLSDRYLFYCHNDTLKKYPLPKLLLRQKNLRIKEDPSAPGRFILYIKVIASVFWNEKFQILDERKMISEKPSVLLGTGYIKSSGWIRVADRVFYNGRLVMRLSSGTNVSFLEDKNGDCWVGTNDGLYKLGKSLFTSYSSKSLTDIYSLFQDHTGTVWAAGFLSSRIFRIDHGKVEQIFHKYHLSRVFSIYEGPDHNLWFGNGSGIGIWNRKTGKERAFPTPFSRHAIQVKVLRFLSKSTLLAGSRAGLWRYNLRSKTWKKMIASDGERLIIEQMEIGPTGIIWVGTGNHGLYVLKGDTLHPFSGNRQLSGVNIQSLYQDKQGVLWIGLAGGGLNRVEFPDTGNNPEITRYTTKDGLFGSTIHSILGDPYGRIWMSSNRGICWVYKSQLNAFANGKIHRISQVVYQKKDGLPCNEANGGVQTPGIISRNGQLWFAMLRGVVSVDPAKVNFSDSSFPTRIQKLVLRDSVIADPDSLGYLPKNQRHVIIDYTAFNYNVKPENMVFSYRMQGLNKNWVYAGEKRQAVFQHLSPGTYIFSVRAGMGGQWDDKHIRSVRIVVEPWFYETTWFRVLVILLALSLLGGFITWVMWKKKVDKEEYEVQLALQEELRTEQEQFLNPLQAYVEKQIHLANITLPELAGEFNISERQLYRKIKEYTGKTPNKYIREIRLLKAKEMLEARNKGTISEVSYAVGFSKASYFVRIFKERFGVHPGEYLKNSDQ